MKNNRLPDSEEWDRIVDEAFSSGEVHKFSEHYNMKKKTILKGAVIMKKHNLLMNLTVAAAAFAVVAFPTGIYLTTRTAETTPAAELPAEEISDNAEASEEIIHDETIYALEMGWLPDGFEQLEENEEGICYGQNGGEAEITVLLLKNVSAVPLSINPDANIVDTAEAGHLDGKSYVINYNDSYDEELADPNVRGRRAMVAFDGTNYLARLIVTDSISKDDLNKIIKEMKLVPTDTETAIEYDLSNTTDVEISDGNNDGEVNEETHVFAEEETTTESGVDYDSIYSLEYGWLPDGLEYQEPDSPYGTKFHNFNTNSGMTPSFVKNLSGEDIETNHNFILRDDYKLDGKTVHISYRDDYVENANNYNFGRIATIYFDNTPYVLSLWVTDDITKEDFGKIIENVHLVPSDTETAYINTAEYQPPQAEKVEFEVGAETDSGILMENAPIVSVGEEVYEKYPDSQSTVAVKVTGVRFDNDFNGLATDGIGNPADYSQWAYADGTLIENIRTFCTEKPDNPEYIIGMGESPVSVMSVVLTCTNNGDTPVDYCVCPTLQTIKDGYFFTPYIYNCMEAQAQFGEDGAFYTDNYSGLTEDSMHFSFSSDHQSNKNNISLAPRETAEVLLAYVVEDKFRDNLYLSMDGCGYVNLSNLE